MTHTAKSVTGLTANTTPSVHRLLITDGRRDLCWDFGPKGHLQERCGQQADTENDDQDVSAKRQNEHETMYHQKSGASNHNVGSRGERLQYHRANAMACRHAVQCTATALSAALVKLMINSPASALVRATTEANKIAMAAR